MKLNTLILPNGYTVDLNADPRSADSGGNETMDTEGKITGGSGKGKDVKTVATTTATGAGVGAIAGGVKGAGIGAGIGGAIGLGAMLLTRGPEANFRAARRSTSCSNGICRSTATRFNTTTSAIRRRHSTARARTVIPAPAKNAHARMRQDNTIESQHEIFRCSNCRSWTHRLLHRL